MTIISQEALTCCIEHREAFHGKILHLARLIMHGEISPVMATTLTMGLRVKKETIGEIMVATTVMREFAAKVDVPAEVSDHFANIAGTGGDGANTFNIFTAPMFVTAAAGARIAEHGGHGTSSKSGNTDVLEALDMNIMLTPEQVAESIEIVDIGFMFVPDHHPAMKNVAPIHKELGVCTIFSILGPLTNPASAPNIPMDVLHPGLVGIQVRVIQWLGARHAMIVYSKDGMDEVSLGAATLVGELKGGVVTEYEIHPEDFGLQMVSSRSLKVVDADESKTMLIEALEDKLGMSREIVSLNTDAAPYAADITGSISDGVKLAHEAITSGVVRARPDELMRVTNRFKA